MIECLEAMYGAETAVRVGDRVRGLLGEWAPRLAAASARRDRLLLSERDALLISYPDQVQEAGEPPLRTLSAFGTRHLKGLVSGIHLLPFYPWSSDDGFSVKDYLTVEPRYGTWEDLALLSGDFDLMFDAVFNHASVQGAWFEGYLAGEAAYRDFFIEVTGEPDLSAVVRPRALPLLTEFPTAAGPRKLWTTFSADQADLNYGNPEVLLRVLDALLFYVAHGARYIRLDAIAFLWKTIGTPCVHLPQTHRFVRLLRVVLDAVAPWVLLVTETNVPHADNIAYFGDGSNEAHLVYNFALPPLVLHSLATGSAATLTRWARSLEIPSDRVAFLNFLASHDGIGLNPGRGILSEPEVGALVEQTIRHGGLVSWKQNPDGTRSPYELNITWFDAVNDPASREPLGIQVDRFMVSQAAMLALRGVPGVYFHSLVGSRNDRVAAESSGIPRRINRQKFQRDLLERELAEPDSLRARVFGRFRALLRARVASAAFDPRGRQEVVIGDPRLFTVVRTSPDGAQAAICHHNLSGDTVGVDDAGAGHVRLGPFEAGWWVNGERCV
ncbi:MAG TPA: sugar phosphorylase [Verrucomicrobiota bacterium]|nr:sugar phosphorylase [Verrucomicrobiota bacterium]HNU50846.1 sugar phosphorylase [Verrucomicrobiota bacterium]